MLSWWTWMNQHVVAFILITLLIMSETVKAVLIYPVLRSAQSALHFTSLTDLFTHIPSQLLWSQLWTYSTKMFISTNVVLPSEWTTGQLSSIIHGLLDAHKLRGLKSLRWCWKPLTVEMSFCLMCSSRRLCRNVPPMRKSNATRPSPSAPSAGKRMNHTDRQMRLPESHIIRISYALHRYRFFSCI